MARPKKNAATAAKKTRKQYSPAYREEALKLAAVKGVAEAARALEIQPALIYNWPRAVQAQGSRGELERELMAENARLKRQLAEQAEELEILGKAHAYFARKLK